MSDFDEVTKFHEARLGDDEVRENEDFSDEEEVMGLGGSSDDSSEDEAVEQEDEDEETWGKENNYGGDDLDGIDNKEEADRIVQESIRIQKKHSEALNMVDYMDEEIYGDWKKGADEAAEEKEKERASVQNYEKLNEELQERFIKSRFPEFYPLWQEFVDLYQQKFETLKLTAQNGVGKVKFVALSSYLGAILNYVNILLAEVKQDEDMSMKDHPIMETILSCREVWRQANGLKDREAVESAVPENESTGEGVVEDGAEEDIVAEEIHVDESLSGEEDDEDNEEDFQKILKKRDLIQRSLASSVHKSSGKDLLEGSLAEEELKEKQKRKKSLRFYTSKIDQQANRKDARFTGDEDLPYKERLFDRQQRLVEEARQRGLDKSDEATNLGGDAGDAEEVFDGGESFEDYYNSVKFAREEKKKNRKDTHKAVVAASKQGKLAEIAQDESIGNDGKRAINYQILKNKGLTAKRKKENQNSRVKKRNQYEKAQKKLKSVRQVYTGQNGVYGGESTGIKKNLTRSVKFKN